MSKRFFCHPTFNAAFSKDQSAYREALIFDFKLYINGTLPKSIGADRLFDHANNPRSILDNKVRHIHIGHEDADWSSLVQDKRTSDDFLVYMVHPDNSDLICLIAFIPNPAHQKTTDGSVMRALGEIAEQFALKSF